MRLLRKSSNGQRTINTLHVNLWGASGFGKSCVAEELISQLRKRGSSAELIREYSKELHWEGRLSDTEQFLITAEQYRRQAALHSKVEIVVTDSAIALGLLHAPHSYRDALSHIVRELTAGWRSLNVLIDRDIEANYSQLGRCESATEAQQHQHRVAALAKVWADSSLLVFNVDSDNVLRLIAAIDTLTDNDRILSA